MTGSHGTGTAVLSDVPAHQRQRVLSGMRWSVWLSAFAVPFGAAINLLLARVGPEAIGVYGLLSVYIGLITAFFYFGGDTVVIKFTPDCSEEDRASFLLSYLVVILIVLIPWLVFAYFCPTAVRLVLGKSVGDRTDFLLLCLAPSPIVFHMVVASLKGMLEIRFSQALAKLLPIISLLAYGLIFVIARPLLASHPTSVIWGIYLGLTGVLATIGARRVFRLCGRPRIRFHLPPGFWRYAFDTQQVGIVNFLTNRIDYVLVLNFGGLVVLGHYVAIMAVAATVPMMNGLFMDTLLPSLTNTIAAGNHRAAAQVFTMHMRILFLVVVAVSCAIMVLAVPATLVMGAKYRSIAGLIILMTMIQGIASPGAFGGTLLSSVGRQRLAVWTGLLDVALFSTLFLGTWHRWNLTGAVMAYGLAILVSNSALMAIALRTAPIYPSIMGLWLKAALVQTGVGIMALWWMPLGPVTAVLIWVAAMVTFLRLSHYDGPEFKLLAQTFIPSGLSSRRLPMMS
jgi:O-antigen/teichoic acid export membrane protein